MCVLVSLIGDSWRLWGDHEFSADSYPHPVHLVATRARKVGRAENRRLMGIIELVACVRKTCDDRIADAQHVARLAYPFATPHDKSQETRHAATG